MRATCSWAPGKKERTGGVSTGSTFWAGASRESKSPGKVGTVASLLCQQCLTARGPPCYRLDTCSSPRARAESVCRGRNTECRRSGSLKTGLRRCQSDVRLLTAILIQMSVKS